MPENSQDNRDEGVAGDDRENGNAKELVQYESGLARYLQSRRRLRTRDWHHDLDDGVARPTPRWGNPLSLDPPFRRMR